MAFTVRDYQDLVRLLDQHPEWKQELRSMLLTDDFLVRRLDRLSPPY